jgi:hypothetical protein
MQRRSIMVALLGFGVTTLAQTQPAPGVQTEINFLLDAVQSSGCEFYRNGSWYNAHKAQAHLRDKYQYLASKNQVNSTEQFIERAATQSSFSGQAYQIRCPGSPAVPSAQWLGDKLAKFRSQK